MALAPCRRRRVGHNSDFDLIERRWTCAACGGQKEIKVRDPEALCSRCEGAVRKPDKVANERFVIFSCSRCGGTGYQP